MHYIKNKWNDDQINLNNKLSNYYTSTEVDNKLKNIDLSSYYTKSDIDSKYPFRLGKDSSGNYGYYKDGADTVTPFKTGEYTQSQYNTYGSTQYNSGYNAGYSAGKSSSISGIDVPSGVSVSRINVEGLYLGEFKYRTDFSIPDETIFMVFFYFLDLTNNRRYACYKNGFKWKSGEYANGTVGLDETDIHHSNFNYTLYANDRIDEITVRHY